MKANALFDIDALGDEFNTCDYEYTKEQHKAIAALTTAELRASGYETGREYLQAKGVL